MEQYCDVRTELRTCWQNENKEKETDEDKVPNMMVTLGGFETSVSQEKQDQEPVINLRTDKSGRLVLDTPDDLQNLLLLRKTKREQRAAVRKPVAVPSSVQFVPYYVDEDDFFKACDQKQLPVIDKYLSTGGEINSSDTFERTGLHRACSKGHIEVVAKLLEAGASVHCRDKLGSTCVHCACRGGHLSVLKLLLEHGGDITALDKLDSTPLHVSVRTGHQDCTEHLIGCRAEVNTQDREGDTPLHDAVRLNRLDIIQLLLVNGADTRIKNQDGQRPLDEALQWQNDVKILLTEQGRK